MTRFEAVDAKMNSSRNETKGNIEGLGKEIESIRNEMISRFDAVDFRFDALEARIPVMEKMAEFEVRLADCVAF